MLTADVHPAALYEMEAKLRDAIRFHPKPCTRVVLSVVVISWEADKV